ncbi:hypothetical protein [Formosa algae]|uniref:Uncharacterized protein n=1 Tax=Formosa algae TaxID=225843 RepID=A0A9X1C9P4_9FLAO|nr:hypothetical protein [Formosa algae]MBP1840663.1 hypothetical protein [Formosa algae]MDQ0335924.1 hypothetical protein [Formosa algae]OEI81180.1 hypothetical protein AST99_05845 [Formosa algae]
MTLKHNVITLLFLTFCTVGFAQDYKKNIESEFSNYLNDIVNMEFEKSMDYITPEFFEIIPKAQLITVLEQTFNNPAMEFEIIDPKVIAVEDAEQIESKYYALLTYSSEMNIKINSDLEETETQTANRLSLTKASFDQTFGAENVSYNKDTEVYNIYAKKDAYAISENGETNWKFLVIEKSQKAILERILPKTLTDRL